MNYNFRQKSDDIDAILHATSAMKDAINQISDEENLPREWINSDFSKTVSYSPHLREYSKHYRTFSNIVEIRTITREYLIAMKLMAQRAYKHDMSDVLGILHEHYLRDDVITLEQIQTAANNLYGSYDNIPEKARNYIEKIFAKSSWNADAYKEMNQLEEENKKALLTFQRENPGVLNNDNIDDIIFQIDKNDKF